MASRRKGFRMGEGIALAVVRNGDGDVLMLKRKVAEGRLVWAFPGGKVEDGEHSSEAACREAGEEAGVACRPLRPLGERTHPVTGKVVSYWLCEHLSGEPSLREPDKADAVAWLAPAAVEELCGDSLFEPVAVEILGAPETARPRTG